jgi:DNA gyrase subunit A
MSKREEDVASDMFIVNSHDYVLFFTNFGRVYRLKCYEIPEGSRTSKGMNIANLLPISSDEKVTSVIRVPEFDDEKYLIMVTKQGLVKRIKLNAYNTNRKGGVVALELNEDDELAWVKMTDGDSQVIIATRLGKAIRFSEENVRPMGRGARGVKALTLAENDSVIGMAVVDDDSMLLTVSETGYGRLSSVADYRVTSRGGKGIINYHTEKYGNVAAISTVNVDEDDIVIISSDGVIIRIEASSIRVCARPSKGVTVMKVNGDNKVVTIAVAPHEEENADEEQQTAEETSTEVNTEATAEAGNNEE